MSKSKSSQKNLRVGMVSLGCPKTLVDSEVLLGKVPAGQFSIASSIDDSDVVLLNTCSFIDAAQKESLDYIRSLLKMKKERKIKSVVVLGCMVQKFPEELQKEFKEVDAFVGTGEYDKLASVLQSVSDGEKVFAMNEPGYLATSGEHRVALTPRHYRYLKISEGCDHICSFCTIPSFRGKHRSRTIEDVASEAARLVAEGAREVILTGQDTSFFGRDLTGKFQLPELLEAMDQVKGLEWLRLLYVYPSCVDKKLIQAMGRSKKLCHYLDMPLQHASDAMLTAMRRGITQRRTRDLIQQFRDEISDLVIRTTFIVGFPGETEKDFDQLLDFMREVKFERVGIFKYSNEASSHSATLPNHVAEKVKEERFHRAMTLQQEIALQNQQKWVGKTIRVLIEEKDASAKNLYRGRSYGDAPEVDGAVLVKSAQTLTAGSFCDAKVVSAEPYDLNAEFKKNV